LPCAALVLDLIALTGCGSSSSTSGDAGGAGGPPAIDVDAECPVIVSEKDCDKTQRPILFVHGTYDSGVSAVHVAQLFASNGFCSDRFGAMDYNSLVSVASLGSGQANNATPAIDVAVDALIAANPGFRQVDILCHSQGAMQCYAYMQDPAHAAKVAHYVQLAGGAQAAPPGPADGGAVPTLSISSNSDTVLGPAGVTGAQKTVVFDAQDHQAVACSTDTFVAIWQYLHQGPDGGPDGQMPKYTEVQCSDPTITLSGLSETLGDNAQPPATDRLEVYELGSDPRDSGAPVQVFTNSDGGPVTWQAKRLVQYEFRGVHGDGTVIGHQYFAPFKRDNRWLRFVVPSQDPLAQVATNPITSLNDNAEATFVFRSSKGAFRPDLGDSLTINGKEILNAQDATKQTVTVALFAFDANKNGKSELGVTSQPGAPFVPYFIRGTDVFIPSSPPALVVLKNNGTTLYIPNWPSVSEGLTEVSFP
jgi:hypothetical protein